MLNEQFKTKERKLQPRYGVKSAPRTRRTQTARRGFRTRGVNSAPSFRELTRTKTEIPDDAEEKKEPRVNIVPLGGMEEVGRNMMYFEYIDSKSPHNGDIIIVDMGLQFPEENMPGIDYIIPNIESLLPKRNKIKGVIISHAHFDHIGAIPHLMPALGRDIPLYGTDITLAIIKKRQEDYKDQSADLNLNIVNNNSKINLGAFDLEFFNVSHNIPGSLGSVINTAVGTFVHIGDLNG